MLIRFHAWLNRWSSGRRLAALLAVAIPFLLALNFLDLPFSVPRLQALSGGVGLLDLLPFYTADEAYRHLAAYGPEGRRLYALGLVAVDFLLPLLMGLTLAVALTLTLRRQGSWPSKLGLLPLLVVAADYIENVCILVMLYAYPYRVEWVGTLAGVCTSTKQASTAAILAVLAWGNLQAWRARQQQLAPNR